MAKITVIYLENNKYYVGWKVENDGERYITHCMVISDDNIRYKGTAICNPADEYDASKGKKLSLMRAVHSIGLKGVDWKYIFEKAKI